jgi:hypothetical protein
MAFKIETLWAYVSENDKDEEGICGYQDPKTQQWLPMIAGNHAHLQALKPFAHQIAKVTKRKVKLVKFIAREDLEVIT